MKDTPENRKKLGIPAGAQVEWIDLDEQAEPPEVVTAGWTDTQIKNKSIDDIDLMIKQNMLAIESMEKALADQHQMVHKLRQVLQRKRIIGGR